MINSPVAIFLSASVGAVLSVFFAEPKMRTSEKQSYGVRLLLLGAYAALAGYVAVFIFQVTQPYQAFLVGLGLDVLLTRTRRLATEYAGAGRDPACTNARWDKHEEP